MHVLALKRDVAPSWFLVLACKKEKGNLWWDAVACALLLLFLAVLALTKEESSTKSISNNLVKFTCQILSYSKLLICLVKEKRMCLQ